MILVTGGTGFVGRVLLVELASRGHEVRVLSRTPRAARSPPLPAGVAVVLGDLHDAPSLAQALRSAHTVIHLAGTTQGDPARLHRSNVEGARQAAIAARRAGVKWFIHVSSAGVYGDAQGDIRKREDGALEARSAYELSKLEGEAAVREALSGGPTGYVVLRPAGIYGGARPATQAFLRDVSKRHVWIRLPPAVIVHPTPVDDVVQAIVACIGRHDLCGEVFNIAGERALSLDDWAQEAAKALHIRLPQLAVPAGIVAAGARAITGVARGFGMSPPSRLAKACRPVISRALDTGKARERLGFVPMPLERALADTVRAARALGALPCSAS